MCLAPGMSLVTVSKDEYKGQTSAAPKGHSNTRWTEGFPHNFPKVFYNHGNNKSTTLLACQWLRSSQRHGFVAASAAKDGGWGNLEDAPERGRRVSVPRAGKVCACLDPTKNCQKRVQKSWTNYFTSSYPHHDIYTFCYWQIFWHSIWHIFWHFIWHIFWHSIWHIFWHSTWHIFWNSIWHSIWHIFWHSIWPMRSSGAHWAGQVPGWGPAVHTELGRSQVEVQRCTLSGQVPGWGPAVPTELGRSQGWGPAVPTELGRSQVEVQRCTLSSDVGEELGKELARQQWKWRQRWWRRCWRRRSRRRIASRGW